VKNTYKLFFIILLVSAFNINAQTPDNTTANDSIPPLPYDFNVNQNAPLFLNSTKSEVIYDAATGRYIFAEKIGDYLVKRPIYMTAEEYKEYRLNRDMLDYYKSKVSAKDGKKKGSDEAQKDLLPKYYVNSKFFESIFGSNEIEVNAQGSVVVSFGVLFQKTENPRISERNRKSTTFDFDQQISASINAKVGTRLNVNINYDTQSTFDFQNLIKLEYTPTEDDIIQKIEVGNVSMPLQSSLINGAQNLFGFKTKLQFGATEITAVFAKQQSQTRSVAAQGGATIQEFELKASEYDKDRHFFLAQKFRDKYDTALDNFPLINSSVNITRVEVWITNRSNQTENVRNIVAIADLAEGLDSNNTNGNIGNTTDVSITIGQHNPSNEVNSLNDLFTNTDIRSISTINTAFSSIGTFGQGTDYTILENAQKLIVGRDFTINPSLGYISLNRVLSESEVLAVAYEYTEESAGQINTYQVGELSGNGIDAPDNLIVKLLRPEIITTTLPIWDLQMKNVYDLRSFQMNSDGFRLEILYQDPTTGVPITVLQSSSTENITTNGSTTPRNVRDIPLLNLLRFDRLDQTDNNEPRGDGFFDYVEGITVNSQQGLIYFPMVEPFGGHLDGLDGDGLLNHPDDELFIFREMYNRTQADAQNNFQSKDRYTIAGYYKSEGRNGIPLGAFNVPRGSVNVTTGGRVLVEGVDYVVDYQIGNVQIINPSLIASNAPIQVSVETNNAFSTQNRRFFGVDVQHKFSENLAIGGTFLNLRERPFTQKAQFGSEPVNNSIAGINFTYNTEVPKLTKWVNYLPNIDTDAPSNLSIRAEAAYLIPNSPKGIELNGEAASYLDDFEGTQIPLNIDSPEQWKMASTPQNQTDATLNFIGDGSNLDFGKKRARLAWYNIDRLFYGSNLRPGNIDDEELSREEVRSIGFNELFPNLDLDITQTNIVRTFDLAYYPEERGSYNYDANAANINLNTGEFTNPEERWGGIMRSLTTTDFQQANVEYIQFWLMNPYDNYSINEAEGGDPNFNPENNTGELYFNLGNISEDILHDNRKMFENGLPEDGNQINDDNVNFTNYSSIPTIQSLLNAFDEDDNSRPNQDVGLDGLNDADEFNENLNNNEEPLANPGHRFGDYITFTNTLNGQARTDAQNDISSDNYRHFRTGADGSVLSRYKNYNRTQGNSQTINNSGDFPTAATQFPDAEDLNRDQTMSVAEGYYQYRIPISQAGFVVGTNNIVDSKTTSVTLANGQERDTRWYQFRIPVQSGGEAIGGISSFNSIRFIRMFVTKFQKPIVLRFGQLELVRGNWRRYTKTLVEPTPIPLVELDNTEQAKFEVGVVSIQENERRIPIPYILPPGVVRERLQGSTSIQQQNEQSLTIKVTDLPIGETRAVFKNTTFDIRMFKKYKMFIHAESINSSNPVDNGEIAAIIRLGSDLVDNYYEIEIPLNITALTGETSAEDVWKNNLDAALEEFGKLRLERFESPTPEPNILYPENGKDFGTYKLYVKGNPTLAKVKSMMLGIKNISNTPKSAELWFNEMRVVDFDNEGGWSAVANINANFADFADIAVSGAMATKGFGSLDQKVNERSQDDTQQYDIVGNINLGQLLPKNYGIKLPLNFSVAEEFKDPKYDPQYQDVLFDETTEANSPNKNNATDYTKRRSFSLINVRKEKTNNKKKAHIYDVENLSVSFAYNDVFHQDYNVEKFNDQNVRAGATYNYSFESKSYEPFKKSKLLGKYKYLKILKDFNINPLPSNFSVNSNIIRSYNEQLSRPLVTGTNLPDLPTLERRRFAFDWDYSIAYDLTKSLQFNFRAANTYINDEFDRDIDNRVIDGQLFDKFFTIGRPEHYTQVLDATYKLPLNKIPILDFITATYNYTANFDWRASSIDNIALVGNTIQNANTHNVNADLNMNKLYKKIGVNKLFKKSANNKAKRLKKKEKAKKKKAKELTKAIKEALKKGDSILVAKLEKKKKATSFSNPKPKTDSSSADNSSVKGKKGSRSSSRSRSFRKKLSFPQKLILAAVDVATSVKKVRISYTENNSTLLPGYVPEIGFLGRDNASGGLAPTLGFVFGSQSSILDRALDNNWLVTRDNDPNSPFYSKTFNNTHFEDLKLNFDLKPTKNLKIDLIASKTKTRNISQQLDVITEIDLNGNTTVVNDPFASPITEVGNFAISNIMIGTAFKNSDALFEEFLSNRNVIAERLASDAGQNNTNGFGENNQSVLLPAFFAAYAGRDVNSVKTSAFRDIPIPNWRVSYKGLSKLKVFKKVFRTITLEHNYQSSYSILGYNSNLQFGQEPFDAVGNHINKLQFQGVNLVEQFSPLIKLDVKMRNSFSFKGEIRKDRSLNLNFANSSITEIEGDEYIVGLGYKFKDVKWTVKPGGKKTVFKGDINLKADFGIRDNVTMIRSISNETDQITGGQRIFTLKFTADYNLNKNLMASFFYDQNSSRFKISTTFPRNSISTGISIRYNIGN